MKKLFLIILLLSIYDPVYSQNQWLKMNSPTTKNLRACWFTDSLKGWIGGDSGLIIHTTDKGNSWTTQATGVSGYIQTFFFFDELNGYALSWELDNTPPNYYGTRIIRTTNGGSLWTSYLYPDSNLFLNSIYFTDHNNGYLVGTNGTLLYTSNAGSNWTRGIIDSGLVLGFPVEEVKFVDSQNGYAVGGAFDIAGVVWKTTNAGRSWRTQIVGPEPMNDLHIFDFDNILCAGGDFEYGSSTLKTSTAGSVWNYHELGVFGIANSIGARTKSEIWISLGIIDSFLVSTNGGGNWRLTATPNNYGIYNIFFLDSLNGWAIGNNGAILKFNSDLIGIDDTELSIPSDFMLEQNYPNPFNPVTNIRFGIPTSGYVSLNVYDLSGKLAATLVNEKKSSGSYEIKFDASGFSSGVYFYSLEVDGNIVDTRKMILLR